MDATIILIDSDAELYAHAHLSTSYGIRAILPTSLGSGRKRV